MLTLDSLTRLLVCAVGVAVLVSAFTLAWRRFLKIDISSRQAAILGSAVVGLLAGFQLTRDYQLAAKVSSIIVGGTFLGKWLIRLMGK